MVVVRAEGGRVVRLGAPHPSPLAGVLECRLALACVLLGMKRRKAACVTGVTHPTMSWDPPAEATGPLTAAW